MVAVQTEEGEEKEEEEGRGRGGEEEGGGVHNSIRTIIRAWKITGVDTNFKFGCPLASVAMPNEYNGPYQ